MKLPLLRAACVWGFLFITPSTNAAFVEIDLFNSGDALLTRDTLTGIEWLDLTATDGLSVNDIVNRVNNSWHQDFQFATREQFDELATNVFSQGGVLTDNVFQFMLMIGMTQITDNGSVRSWKSVGFVDPFEGDPAMTDIGQFRMGSSTFSPLFAAWERIEDNATNDHRNTLVGSYLVRRTSVVPIPPAVFLFASGLLGLAGMAKRRSQS